MVSIEIGQQLHDRFTRGQTLSPEEKLLLDEWRAHLDHEELALLTRTASENGNEDQPAVDEQLVARVVTLSQQIQTMTKQNAELRRKVAELERQVANKLTSSAS